MPDEMETTGFSTVQKVKVLLIHLFCIQISVFITNGFIADTVLVCAITDRDVRASKGMSMFLVDTTLPGFERGKMLKKIGNHHSDTAELFFQDISHGTNFYSLLSLMVYEKLCEPIRTYTYVS